LLVYPQFPKTFWSFEAALALIGRKALVAPLGLPTVAALLPQDWEFKLVDRNVRPVTEAEWAWADVVMLSAMLVQQQDFCEQIREARSRGKCVVVGGPYPTSVPHDAEEAGADYLVLDEGELTIPMFLDSIRRRGWHRRQPGEAAQVFRSAHKPDVTATPLPRFDLLELDAYDTMPVQYSRGCPFQCEFCDIITLYGRKPRTKTPGQILAELDCLYELGWRHGVFLVDDNFIGNKRNVKVLLRALAGWQAERNFPFCLCTEASVDLAADAELLDWMGRSGFEAVFLGIETPDQDSLKLTKKYQNTRSPLTEAVQTIMAAGIRVMAGFIIGFDNERPGAGERIRQFAERTAIPTVFLSMLQALPHTGLWDRLTREDRLLKGRANLNQTDLVNFVPTRPAEEIAGEYVAAFWDLYDPVRYLDRVHRCFMQLGPPRAGPQLALPALSPRHGLRKVLREGLVRLRALATVCWRQGVKRPTRWQFWRYLLHVLLRNPRMVVNYVVVCAFGEHFLEYRQVVRDQVEEQTARSRSRAPWPLRLPAAEQPPRCG
jgi:radical SAM superfamily enzyme YgiQ (UPF0313 family)